MKEKSTAVKYDLRRAYSLTASAITALIKLITGALSASAFIVISGFYSLGTGIAKEICHIGKNRGGEEGGNLYFAIAATHAASAVLYAACAIRQFYVPPVFGYGQIAAITVAAVAFYELGAAIAGIVKASKKGGYALALKRINLSKAAAAIALTQIALLSTGEEGNAQSGAVISLIAAAVMGGCALATALQGIKERRARQSDAKNGCEGEEKDAEK